MRSSVGLEAEPDVALLAQRLVVVRQVVDEREVAAGAQQARRRGDRVLRARGVVEHARQHDEIGAAARADLLDQAGVVDVALAQAHVGQAPARRPARRSGPAAPALRSTATTRS